MSPLLLLLLLSGADPRPLSADRHAELAASFLERLDPELRCNVRFLSFYNYGGDKFLDTAQKIQAFWINNVHFAADVTLPQAVPDTGGTLYWIDIRDYEWNAQAFSSVARREPYFREPAVSSLTAIRLRKLIGVDQDPRSLHAEAIVRADWFFRETSEADRSDSYFDLLFAKRRFLGAEEVEVDQEYGYYYDAQGQRVDKSTPGAVWKTLRTERIKKLRQAKFVNFPKNEEDFERAFGVDGVNKFIRESGIALDHGAVVEGGEKGISIVSRQNRLLQRKTGPLGAYWKTFDVKETTGKRDFVETLQKGFEFDAGEILARTPSGGMAALVVNSKGEIAATADNRFATDKSDSVLDARVRTATSCFVCHESFAIKPQNMIEDMLKAGVQIKFKNKRDQVEARAFFLNWEDDIESDQAKFKKFIARTSGYATPGENAKNFKAWRDRYDSQIGLQVAAAEIGMTQDELKAVALRSSRARILNLAQGITMPRKTWEVDGYPEIIKLMRATQ